MAVNESDATAYDNNDHISFSDGEECGKFEIYHALRFFVVYIPSNHIYQCLLCYALRVPRMQAPSTYKYNTFIRTKSSIIIQVNKASSSRRNEQTRCDRSMEIEWRLIYEWSVFEFAQHAHSIIILIAFRITDSRIGGFISFNAVHAHAIGSRKNYYPNEHCRQGTMPSIRPEHINRQHEQPHLFKWRTQKTRTKCMNNPRA